MKCWRGYLLERSANRLHMVQLMPLPPHHVCFSKIQNGLSFWYQPTLVVLEKRPLKRLSPYFFIIRTLIYQCDINQHCIVQYCYKSNSRISSLNGLYNFTLRNLFTFADFHYFTGTCSVAYCQLQIKRISSVMLCIGTLMYQCDTNQHSIV